MNLTFHLPFLTKSLKNITFLHLASVSLIGLISCQSPTAPSQGLNLEFGSCLGELNQVTSCSSQIFKPLTRGNIGCWALESSTDANRSFRTSMNWDGSQLTLSNDLAFNDFPFTEGETVNMQLFLFDSIITAEFCPEIDLSLSCEETLGCVAKIQRNFLTLSFNESLSFRSENNVCVVETPQISAVELCGDDIDGDCDGIFDENCIEPGDCQAGDIRICENACGRGEQRCIDGVYTSCPMPSTELCTENETSEAVDEDCDGIIDENCNENCSDGETRPCQNACGTGLATCSNGEFIDCSAPQMSSELCDDRLDNDCDGIIDENCQGCVEGDTRECFSICGIGEELCTDNNFGLCTAPQPVPEVCGDGLDNDCDQNFDEDCPSCVPTTEVCDGFDNDCDSRIDEGTVANQACLAVKANCGGQFPGFILCTANGTQQCIPNESLYSEGEELCDGVDNDCDGLVDNVPNLNMSCLGEVSAECAYSRWVCNASSDGNNLGQVQDLSCESSTAPIELCDGNDNDCDGRADEEIDLSMNACTASCNRTGVQSCVNGIVECQATQDLPIETCGDQIDNNCNGQIDEGCCAQAETLCDGIDDDCNGQIDENVCGNLIYQHCEARLAWWDTRTVQGMLPAPPWNQWPLGIDLNQSCPVVDDLDRRQFSCDVARAQTNFQTIIIQANAFEQLGLQQWLGIGWSCEANTQLSAHEQALVAWANTHCHLALAYKDIGNLNEFSQLLPNTCPQASPYPGVRQARCIQTQATHNYSAIELEGGVNFDDFFGLAFYCDSNDPPTGVNGVAVAQSIQNQFQVFFGSDQSLFYSADGVYEWSDLPQADLDNIRTVRGVGTRADGAWRGFNLNQDLANNHRFGMMIRAR